MYLSDKVVAVTVGQIVIVTVMQRGRGGCGVAKGTLMAKDRVSAQKAN